MRLKAQKEPRIDWRYIDPKNVSVSNRRTDKGLSIADGLAHAAFKAIEPDPHWEHFETCYLELIKERLWRGPKGDDLLDNGLVTLPWGEQRNHSKAYPWMKRL